MQETVRRVTGWLAPPAFVILGYLVWFQTPDWTYAPEVNAPLTRKILFYHPASAWTAFAAYFIVFSYSVGYLTERRMKYDAPARAAAEVGFAFNTIALLTGTFWGMQEWGRSGESALATVYTEPKVIVVVVMWLTFGAYLLLRRFVDSDDRRARLAAIFGVLGFAGVPLSFVTSRVLQTSLHPDIAGPGANPDAAVSDTVGMVLGFSLVAMLLLFIHLWLQRWRLLRLEADIASKEHP